MRLRHLLPAISLAALPLPGAAASDQTVVEAVVFLRGSGTTTCTAGAVSCSGTTTADVVFAGPSYAAYAGPAAANIQVLQDVPGPLVAIVTVDVGGAHVEIGFFQTGCSMYGPDSSSGTGAGHLVVEERGSGHNVTFACAAVLVEENI